MNSKVTNYMLATLILLLGIGCKESSLFENIDDQTNEEGSTTTPTEVVIGGNHESEDDYTWDISSEIAIKLNGNSIEAESDNISISGTTCLIQSSGNYRILGILNDGQIVVDTDDEETLRLILDGVTISSSTSAPIYIANAEKTILIVEDGSENYLSDASEYVYENEDDDEPDATIFSDDDLTIYGLGSIDVVGNFNEAIKSKDGLIILGTSINISSVDDGIQGKDYLIIKSGNFIIDAEGDGLKSSNDEDAELGYIELLDGSYEITSGADAIQAETNLIISGGTYSLVSGGGSSHTVSGDDFAKGLKSGISLTIDNGTFTISSADDAIHCNESITINNGEFLISSGDDGIHADNFVTIADGTFEITKSYEGIESEILTINGGTIILESSDDGLNVAGGVDNSGFGGGHGGPSSSNSNYHLYINGGYIAIYASGDGLDANGSITMTAGTVIVHGPTSNGNGAIDYDRSFEISGGTLIAAGSAGMAQAPDNQSTQNSIKISFNSTKSAGTLFYLEADSGGELITFAPSKTYQSIVFSSPALTTGSVFNAYIGGSSTGNSNEGVYTGGSYENGTKIKSVTISGTITSFSY